VTGAQARAASAIESALAELGLAAESPQPGSYLVRLEGEHKLATMTWLIAGAHSLHVEAFFCRQPDENHAPFYRFLLERNGRMYGVHFAVDTRGDVYLVGRLPLSSVAPDEIDRVLGCGTLVVSDASEVGRVALPDVPRVEQLQLQLSELLYNMHNARSDDGT